MRSLGAISKAPHVILGQTDNHMFASLERGAHVLKVRVMKWLKTSVHASDLVECRHDQLSR